MKTLLLLSTISCVLVSTGCETTSAAAPPPPAPSVKTTATTPTANADTDAVEFVRNGKLVDYDTTTVGKALEGTFQNGKWSTFVTQKGIRVVQYIGEAKLGDLRGEQLSKYISKKRYCDEVAHATSDQESFRCHNQMPADTVLSIVFQFAITDKGFRFEYSDLTSDNYGPRAVLDFIYR